MEQRQHRVDDLATIGEPRHPGTALSGVGTQVAMGEYGGLGPPGRAAGVLEQGDVGARRARMGRGQRRPAQEALPPADAGSGPGHRGPGPDGPRDRQPQGQPRESRQRGGEADRQHRGSTERLDDPPHHRRHLVPGDHHARPVVGQLEGHLLLGVERVVLHHDRAQPERGVEGDHVLGTVRQHQGDPVPRADAQPAQALGGPGDLAAELGVRGGRPEEVESDQRGEPGRGRLQEVDQRLLGDVDVQRHAGRVAARPRTLIGSHRASFPLLRSLVADGRSGPSGGNVPNYTHVSLTFAFGVSS